jgi:hypothetical protein
MNKQKVMVPVYLTEDESNKYPMLCSSFGFESAEDLRQYLQGRKLLLDADIGREELPLRKKYNFTAGALAIRQLRRAFLKMQEGFPDLEFKFQDDGGLLERTFLLSVEGKRDMVMDFDNKLKAWTTSAGVQGGRY